MEEVDENSSNDNDFDLICRSQGVEESEDVYLALYHQAGHLGAAFYNVSEGVLYVMNDLADPVPQHRLVFSLLAQIDPKFLLVSSRHNDTIGEQVKQMDSMSSAPNSSLDTSAFASLERNSKLSESFQNVEVIVLPSNYFSLESSRRRVFSQKLPGENQFTGSEDHYLMIHSLINPTCEFMIRACGALLKYLDKHNIGGMNLDCGGVPILAIKTYTPTEVVQIDNTTLTSLQVFSLTWQNSGTRSGRYNQRREGLSLYSLVNKTKSPNGSKYMKYMLKCLPRDIEVIKNRQYALAYFNQPSQLETTKLMKEALSKIRSANKYLKKLTSNQATVQDWKSMKSTLKNMLYLSQICANNVASNPNSPHIVQCIGEKVHGDSLLGTLVQSVEKVFDVEDSESKCRFTVKPGVDEALDEKKRVHNGLPDLLLKLAQEEIDELPPCMSNCQMLYIPQVG